MEGDIGPTATAILDTQKEEEVREWGGGGEGEGEGRRVGGGGGGGGRIER